MVAHFLACSNHPLNKYCWNIKSIISLVIISTKKREGEGRERNNKMKVGEGVREGKDHKRIEKKREEEKKRRREEEKKRRREEEKKRRREEEKRRREEEKKRRREEEKKRRREEEKKRRREEEKKIPWGHLVWGVSCRCAVCALPHSRILIKYLKTISNTPNSGSFKTLSFPLTI
jgi:hypothetical protein